MVGGKQPAIRQVTLTEENDVGSLSYTGYEVVGTAEDGLVFRRNVFVVLSYLVPILMIAPSVLAFPLYASLVEGTGNTATTLAYLIGELGLFLGGVAGLISRGEVEDFLVEKFVQLPQPPPGFATRELAQEWLDDVEELQRSERSLTATKRVRAGVVQRSNEKFEKELEGLRAEQARKEQLRLISELGSGIPSRVDTEKRYSGLLAEVGAYYSDPLQILEYPSLNDSSLSEATANFLKAKEHADIMRSSGSDLDFWASVRDCAVAWKEAWEDARKKRLTVFNARQQEAVMSARKLLANALDQTNPEPVRREFLQKAVRKLQGLITLPARATEALERGVRPQIEAEGSHT